MAYTAEVKASPEGVPGAVTDPARVRAEDLTYPGTEGAPVKGYLATPAAPAGAAGRPASSR